MRFILTILIAYFATSVIYAQNKVNTVSGYIYSSEKNGYSSPLSYSSISILYLPDSVFVTGSTTDELGFFKIKYHIPQKGTYLLKVSYTGMTTYYYTLKQKEYEEIDSIILKDQDVLLDEIFITAKQPEIQYHKDTTIINSKAFKVTQNAYLQELIKKIPGIVYDADNNKLSYNGKHIQEIDVNSKPFFNQDIQMALNNLPAKFISTIKVYNKADKTYPKNNNEEYYVLDLQTKEEFNGSLLNSIKIGYGTQRKKDTEGQVNYFEKSGNNLSVILSSTNKDINSLYKDNISQSIGLNIFRQFNERLNISANIRYNKNKIGENSKNYTEQYLQNGNLYSLGTAEYYSKNKLLSSFLGIEWKPNKKTSIMFNIGYDHSQSNSTNYNNTNVLNNSRYSIESDISTIPQEFKINSNLYETLSNDKDHGQNWQTIISRDINENIRLDFNLKYDQNKTETNDFANSTINYYQIKGGTNNDSTYISQQYIYSPLNNNTWNSSLSIFHSISKSFIITYYYNLHIKKETIQRLAYNLFNSNMNIGQLIPCYERGYIDSLSNNSHSRSNFHNIGLHLNYNSDQWNINANFIYSPLQRKINQQTGIIKTDTIIHSVDYQSFISASWHKDDLNISLYYNGLTNQPPLSTLIPVTNISNPLDIIKGNPNLKRAFTHSFNLNLRGIKGISSSLGYQVRTNDIALKTLYDEITGRRKSYPININGNWNANANISWNKSFGNFRLYLNESSIYNEHVSLIGNFTDQNPEHSKTRDFNLQSKLQLSYLPPWGNIELSSEHQYSQSSNSLRENNVYMREYKIGLNSFFNIFKDIQISNNIGYNHRSGTAIENNQNTEILWNLSVTWLFLKNKSAELSLHWADILRQRKNYIRNVTSNSFYEYQTQQVPGYILFSFKYNFNIELNK